MSFKYWYSDPFKGIFTVVGRSNKGNKKIKVKVSVTSTIKDI